ncbi:MAG: hypothetical protein KDF59_14090 [Nitrosomonas sp.]|nr:hypothetical protein [Nitrosomonas sp.]
MNKLSTETIDHTSQKKNTLKCNIIALLSTGMILGTGAPLANAAGNGNSPQGKPFVEIAGQIVEVKGSVSSLQEQIDLLVARVDTMEDRVIANEDAISTLQTQNNTLNTLIGQGLSDIGAIQAEILTLQQANQDLLTMIAAGQGDIAALEAEVAGNKALIASLSNSILLVEGGMISLETSLQSQIDNNTMLINALQNEVNNINDLLALKQNLVNGSCPNNYAIQQILSDGSVICEMTGSSMSGQLHSVVSYQYKYVAPSNVTGVYAYCPIGYIVSARKPRIQHQFACFLITPWKVQ